MKKKVDIYEKQDLSNLLGKVFFTNEIFDVKDNEDDSKINSISSVIKRVEEPHEYSEVSREILKKYYFGNISMKDIFSFSDIRENIESEHNDYERTSFANQAKNILFSIQPNVSSRISKKTKLDIKRLESEEFITEDEDEIDFF